ncbi:type II secretion system protein [Shewanella corallii]|uniref:type II secretion system protein n=1 Tax=Shewanella corallii TaxID=560080 RepID=UPI0024B3A400|nr:type II secretion system protein [Shewanella corallii]
MFVSRDARLRAKGFTLIELVVVIIILGILAVVAAPKFINMQDEAEEAAILTQFAAFQSAVKLYHSGWLAAGNTARVNSLEGFGNGDVSSTPTGWPYGTEAAYSPGVNGHDQYSACIELWNGLTDTELTAEGTDSENHIGKIDSDIGVTYQGSTCIYVASHFVQQGQETLQLSYNNDTGDVSIKDDAHYDENGNSQG